MRKSDKFYMKDRWGKKDIVLGYSEDLIAVGRVISYHNDGAPAGESYIHIGLPEFDSFVHKLGYKNASDVSALKARLDRRLTDRDTAELPRDGCRVIVDKILREEFRKLDGGKNGI